MARLVSHCIERGTLMFDLGSLKRRCQFTEWNGFRMLVSEKLEAKITLMTPRHDLGLIGHSWIGRPVRASFNVDHTPAMVNSPPKVHCIRHPPLLFA